MYFTQSERDTIFAYDFDAETGAISNKRPFFKPESGTPDGHAQDVDGNLWVALWGGSKVVRVSPGGTVTAEIALPTRCPTVRILLSGILGMYRTDCDQSRLLCLRAKIYTLPAPRIRRLIPSIQNLGNIKEDYSSAMSESRDDARLFRRFLFDTSVQEIM